MISVLNEEGLLGLKLRFLLRIAEIFPKRGKYRRYKDLFSGKGIEFGGKSKTFDKSGYWPIYQLASSMDNCNFFDTTVWEGRISEGSSFNFHSAKPNGWQYISEASHIPEIRSGNYDFVISCHMLEHSANPILVLEEWQRIMRANGKLLLILPHHAVTVDHLRSPTSLQHMIDDYRNNIKEDDQTHLNETLKFHDRAMDPYFKTHSNDDFNEMMHNNFANRTMHHHVFNAETAIKLLNHCGFKVLHFENYLEKSLTRTENSIILIAEKKDKGEVVDNEIFIYEAVRADLMAERFAKSIGINNGK